MKRKHLAKITVGLVALFGTALTARASDTVFEGKDAFGDYQRDAPGILHRITLGDLPQPFASQSARNFPQLAPRNGAMPKVPAGFSVSIFADGFKTPREMKIAPNGDIFLAESGAGRVHVLRSNGAGKPPTDTVFAEVAERPFGIGFFPAGPNPKYVYIASMNEVVRFPYEVGDTKARGPKEMIVPNLPGPTHWTRDVLVTPDSQHILVAVGSSSNIADKGMEAEQYRANILQFNPDGSGRQVLVSGTRNPVAIAFNPVDGSLWTSVNERDLLGDNLPADYVTHVQPGKFYGWPYFYNGNHRDPRVEGNAPVPGDQVVVADVLIQPHSAPLGIAFYTGNQFPAEYRNDLFVALHGSWNRGLRTGYKLIRVKLQDGKAIGQYEDFMTGFVDADANVWGRPVGVAVAPDGSLLMSDDGTGILWQISYGAAKQAAH
ncbi:MAG TPA: sorbosone dehydrogenase family protein [Stellaceae bacterium]|nr:sorbosone dehydrogenase family protein [Stellaceae bacterium]